MKNPETLLPLYSRLLIYLFAFLFAAAIAFFVLSLIKCKSPTVFKVTARVSGIIAAVLGLVILYYLCFHWHFLALYGFKLFGAVISCLPWLYGALSVFQAVLCGAAFARGVFEKHGRIAYGVVSLVNLLFFGALLFTGLPLR